MSDLKSFNLTPLTRGNERRTIFLRMDLKTAPLIVLAIAMFPAVLLTAIFWLIIGIYAILMIPLVLGAAYLLFVRRMSSGLNLKTYRALWDQKNANTGIYTMCGKEIDPYMNRMTVLRSNTVPVERPEIDPLRVEERTAPPAPHRVSKAKRSKHYRAPKSVKGTPILPKNEGLL